LAIGLIAALSVTNCVGAVLEAGKAIKAAYYRMLVALYGDLPSFDFFRPKQPTADDRLEIMLDLTNQFLGLKGGPQPNEVQWRGGVGRQPGG